MPPAAETFNLAETMQAVSQAFGVLVCHIGFDFGLHGLIIGLIFGLLGLYFLRRGHRFGRPMLALCRKMSLICLILMVPGGIALASSGHLPSTGNVCISSLGFLVFWSLISLHLLMEEMNYQWFA